jgi:hypothetical protein
MSANVLILYLPLQLQVFFAEVVQLLPDESSTGVCLLDDAFIEFQRLRKYRITSAK